MNPNHDELGRFAAGPGGFKGTSEKGGKRMISVLRSNERHAAELKSLAKVQLDKTNVNIGAGVRYDPSSARANLRIAKATLARNEETMKRFNIVRLNGR